MRDGVADPAAWETATRSVIRDARGDALDYLLALRCDPADLPGVEDFFYLAPESAPAGTWYALCMAPHLRRAPGLPGKGLPPGALRTQFEDHVWFGDHLASLAPVASAGLDQPLLPSDFSLGGWLSVDRAVEMLRLIREHAFGGDEDSARLGAVLDDAQTMFRHSIDLKQPLRLIWDA